ncbi:MAG: iron transporter [Flavobacteriia bacterium]|nr:MAG: iron transporter [Flavobacteriia bacterium]
MFKFLKKLGPGLLFAGAAIGVSHLVQSTRAGASFGYGWVWALLLIHAIKYPFFQFAPRYTTSTGENLITGYHRLGRWVLVFYFIMTLFTMFTIQAAVTVVTAGLAKYLFGIEWSNVVWSAVILLFSAGFLLKGRYQLLDKLMKIIIITLTISTLTAFLIGIFQTDKDLGLIQRLPTEAADVIFLIAFLGWMPAPLDVTIWQSLWTEEKQKAMGQTFDTKQSVFDFNIGFIGTIITGLLFISLGTLAWYNTPESLSPKAGVFAQQLIAAYKSNLGNIVGFIVGIAALTTMFSTTITTLDASPRAMSKTFQYLTKTKVDDSYLFWMVILVVGTLIILGFLVTEMGLMIKIATIISFLTAPFYAIANLILINSKHVRKKWRPSKLLNIWAIIGIILLFVFDVWYLTSLF